MFTRHVMCYSTCCWSPLSDFRRALSCALCPFPGDFFKCARAMKVHPVFYLRALMRNSFRHPHQGRYLPRVSLSQHVSDFYFYICSADVARSDVHGSVYVHFFRFLCTLSLNPCSSCQSRWAGSSPQCPSWRARVHLASSDSPTLVRFS